MVSISPWLSFCRTKVKSCAAGRPMWFQRWSWSMSSSKQMTSTDSITLQLPWLAIMTWRMKDKHWQHWDAWRAVFFVFFLPNLCLWNQCASRLSWKFAFQSFDCPVGSQLQRAPPQYCTSSEHEGIVASWTPFPCAKQPVSLPRDVFKPGKLREYSTSCLYAALGWNAYKRWLSGHVLLTVWAHGGAEVKQRGTYQQKSLKRMKWRIETCAVLKRPQNVFLQKIWSIIGIDLFSEDLVTFPESLDLKFVYPNPSEHKVSLADVQSFALHGLSIRRFVVFFRVEMCRKLEVWDVWDV